VPSGTNLAHSRFRVCSDVVKNDEVIKGLELIWPCAFEETAILLVGRIKANVEVVGLTGDDAEVPDTCGEKEACVLKNVMLLEFFRVVVI